ncbi:MAG: shikimate dehydrogenase [Bacteroidales bacterium]|jgi:shikimate dehydrogenase|nr:shikimate dehydrogenase [Bacteroidales bacterium]
MRKFGLIGYPLGHSFSQKYFTGKFARENITDCSYENFPIKSIKEFPELLRHNTELCGLNVTIPFKTEILQYADIAEDAVDQIGAANVLKIKRENGKTYISAYNSDVYGIKDSLVPCTRGKERKILILGTGGSSKAVAWTVKKMGCEAILVSRTRKPGILSYSDITSSLLESVDLIINTTPLGMYPDIESKPEFDYNLLTGKHILFDLVYNPEMTAFLRMGKERGCKIITGMKMLRSQADRSWEIWNEDIQ